MGAKDTGKRLFAVIGDPGELTAVVVQETGGEADASAGGNICQRRIMIRTVEITDFTGADETVWDCS